MKEMRKTVITHHQDPAARTLVRKQKRQQQICRLVPTPVLLIPIRFQDETNCAPVTGWDQEYSAGGTYQLEPKSCNHLAFTS
jgi:hypothetical protein